MNLQKNLYGIHTIFKFYYLCFSPFFTTFSRSKLYKPEYPRRDEISQYKSFRGIYLCGIPQSPFLLFKNRTGYNTCIIEDRNVEDENNTLFLPYHEEACHQKKYFELKYKKSVRMMIFLLLKIKY